MNLKYWIYFKIKSEILDKKRGEGCEKNVQDKNFHNETIISSISFLEILQKCN